MFCFTYGKSSDDEGRETDTKEKIPGRIGNTKYEFPPLNIYFLFLVSDAGHLVALDTFNKYKILQFRDLNKKILKDF